MITKADLVPKNDWGKISAEFQGRFGNLIAAHWNGDLYFTSCKNFQNPGAHFKRLTRRLSELALAAREEKLCASEQFVVDTSRKVERILRVSAEQVVSNLQVIADTADEIAIEAMRLTKQAIKLTQHEAENFLETKITGLEGELRSIYTQLAPLLQSNHPETELKEIAERRLRKYLEEDRLKEKLNSTLDQVGKDICTYATVISETKVLEKTRISSSLWIKRDKFSIRFDIPLSSLKANVKLPPIELPGGCLLLLAMLSGAVSFGGILLLALLITIFQ